MYQVIYVSVLLKYRKGPKPKNLRQQYNYMAPKLQTLCRDSVKFLIRMLDEVFHVQGSKKE